MKKLKALAVQISEQLHTIDIKDGSTRIVWRDNTPEDLQSWFRDVTADHTGYSFAELDECYLVLKDLSSLIAENIDTNTTTEELENAIYNADWSSVYNFDCLKWVSESSWRVDDVNNELQNGSTNLIQAIQDAMNKTRQETAIAFLDKMIERVK